MGTRRSYVFGYMKDTKSVEMIQFPIYPSNPQYFQGIKNDYVQVIKDWEEVECEFKHVTLPNIKGPDQRVHIPLEQKLNHLTHIWQQVRINNINDLFQKGAPKRLYYN